ncbi:hypothetical protein [Gluconobacter sp. P1D12_c]|uniref:hypothetical protein n=1 Tax=Gluconobacter sp. P1D12_c TaxID=2762614 RepID=UPI001C051459|nr:hypothetical protein [Gluconobacter sp. P1D12_c]
MAVCLLVMWRLSGHFADVTDLIQTTLVLHSAQEGAQLHEGGSLHLKGCFCLALKALKRANGLDWRAVQPDASGSW